MSNKFDAEAYVDRWEKIIIPAMLSVIVISLVLATYLNIKTRPDCLRHEYVYCGTPSQASYDDAAPAHGEHAGEADGEHHAPH